jgi:hypothetical protein
MGVQQNHSFLGEPSQTVRAIKGPGGRLILKVAIAWILFLAMAGFKTYPLIRHFTTHIPSDLGDPLLNAWILAWDFHALSTDPWNLFNANILYPLKNTLALSEHLMGVLPIFAPAYAMTGNPVIAYNIMLFLSFPLCGIAMFLLVYYWTQNFWAALISGVLFAFAPARFGQLYHVQLLNLYWTPIALLFLERFLRTRSWGNLLGFAICYWMQVLACVYLGWFATIAIVMYMLYHIIIINKDHHNRLIVIRSLIFVILSIITLLPLHFPYYEVKQQWGFNRSITESGYYSADLLLSYLNVPPLMHDLYLFFLHFAQSINSNGEKQLFPGFVMLFLVILGSLPTNRIFNSDALNRLRRVSWLILVSSLILSLGPFLVVLNKQTDVPLPYWLFHQLVPGFSALRTPARFGLMVMLAASVLAGLGFLRLCDYLNGRFHLQHMERWSRQLGMATLCIGLFMMELGVKPFPLVKIQTDHEVPAVYRWLATQRPSGAIVELPFGHAEDYQYTYFSTYHWFPLVNGRSGFVPPTYLRLTSALDALPSRSAIQSLGSVGVKWIVVHTDRLQPREAHDWGKQSFVGAGLDIVAEFGPDVVYQLPPAHYTHRLHLEMMVPDRLPAGRRLPLGLLASGEGGELWTHPPPLGRTKVSLEWQRLPVRKTDLHEEKVLLPLLIQAGNVEQIGLSVRTPASPGDYWLRVDFPTLGISPVSKRVTLSTEDVPTSRSSPQLLAASYSAEAVSPLMVTSPRVRIALKATNVGEATWLARNEGDRGAVRIGWRWFKGDQEIPGTSGRETLLYNVYPGLSYSFGLEISTPQEPGEYRLELGLVCEHMTWFDEQGVEPVQLTILVPSRS